MLGSVTRESSVYDFGLLIAYVLPGFTALWGTTYVWPLFRPWFGLMPSQEPTLGGFLFLTLASVGAGLTVSTVRWLVIDTLHHRTGIAPPSWDFRGLVEAESGYRLLVEIHYRYFQFYANMVIALGIVLVCRLVSGTAAFGGLEVLLLASQVIFYVGSRDALAKYYRRGEQLLRRPGSRKGRPSLASVGVGGKK
jgi:hypothetical protein